MISEQDKQAILNGAYAIIRNGRKAKYIGTYASNDYPYYFIFLDEDGDIVHSTALTKDFKEYENASSEADIVGLWQDKPEPFDLGRALAGELVKYSDKPCYVYQSKVTGLFWVEAQDGSFVDNDTSLEDVSEQGMWKEPEPVSNTVTLTLPCPLKEPKNEMWYISAMCTVCTSSYKENEIYKFNSDKERFEAGFYFGSKEDAQAWLDALKDNRR